MFSVSGFHNNYKPCCKHTTISEWHAHAAWPSAHMLTRDVRMQIILRINCRSPHESWWRITFTDAELPTPPWKKWLPGSRNHCINLLCTMDRLDVMTHVNSYASRYRKYPSIYRFDIDIYRYSPPFAIFSERELKFTFAICHRRSVCLSVVCLSVTFVRPTQAIEIFGNISTPCGTLAIHDLCIKILRRSSQGNPSVGGVKHEG